MDKQIKNIYIDAPASSSVYRHENDFISGYLTVPCININESVKVALVIGKKKQPRSIKEWSKILDDTQVTNKVKTPFVITKHDWLNNGLICVISTPIFETTPIKIFFEKNYHLQEGFQIEIFSRDTVITREVPPSSELTIGATVAFEINWTITSNTDKATPIVETLV